MLLRLNRCFIFLLLLLGSVQVLSAPINEPKTGFSVNVDFPKTTHCVVYPHKPYDADVCPIDNYLFPTEDANMIARGVIRFAPGEMLFNIAYLKAPFTAPMNQKEAEVFIGKYLELFNAYDSETLDSGMVLVNDQPFYRYYGDVGSDTALPYSRILFYTFSGKGYHYFISFNFDATQEKKAFEVSDHILRSIRVPLPVHSEKGELIYQLSYEVFFSVSVFVSLFLFLSVVSFVFQREFPKERFSIFRRKGMLAFEGVTRFIALSVPIIGVYEVTVAFRSWEAIGTFLGIYGLALVVFVLLRGFFRWVRVKFFKSSIEIEPPVSSQTQSVFFLIGIPKFIILSIFTFGLYSFYWFYRNWAYVQSTTTQPLYPLLKAVFYPICAYFLFKRIRHSARTARPPLTLHAGLWAGILILCYLIDMIPLGNLIPGWFLVLLGLLMFFLEFAVLIPVQCVVNQLNKQQHAVVDFNQRFTWVDGVVCAIGGVTLLGIIYFLQVSWRLAAQGA